jgi:hypothetical protein
VTLALDRPAAAAWIRSVVGSGSVGALKLVKERPWATVLQAVTPAGLVYFKACRPVQAFEPRLSADLFERWPDRVAEVLAFDAERGWLLTADAGDPVEALGNEPELWLRILPGYAELQRAEAEHAASHLTNGVPDLRLATLPGRFESLLGRDLPLEPEELRRLRGFSGRFESLCADLAASGPRDTIQHDDLHARSVFIRGDRMRILDWGDASIAHPFASLVVTFQFLEEQNGLLPGDPWYARLRDAYLEPWGGGATTMEAAFRVGLVAHAFAWLRHRDAMADAPWPPFDGLFAALLRRILARAVDP